jgi:hypothetical protein
MTLLKLILPKIFKKAIARCPKGGEQKNPSAHGQKIFENKKWACLFEQAL